MVLGLAILIALLINVYLSAPGSARGAAMTEQSGPTAAADTAREAAEEVIRADHLSKRFGPVTALRDINLSVWRGEILGLVGDNGAGRSTLIKILTGFHRPDSGQLVYEGEPVRLRSVTHARSLGIETVFQDLAMVNELPVYLKLHLNKKLVHKPPPFLRRREMKRRAPRRWTPSASTRRR